VIVGQSGSATVRARNDGTAATGALTVSLAGHAADEFAVEAPSASEGVVAEARATSRSRSGRATPAPASRLTLGSASTEAVTLALTGSGVVDGPLTIGPTAHDFREVNAAGRPRRSPSPRRTTARRAWQPRGRPAGPAALQALARSSMSHTPAQFLGWRGPSAAGSRPRWR